MLGYWKGVGKTIHPGKLNNYGNSSWPFWDVFCPLIWAQKSHSFQVSAQVASWFAAFQVSNIKTVPDRKHEIQNETKGSCGTSHDIFRMLLNIGIHRIIMLIYFSSNATKRLVLLGLFSQRTAKWRFILRSNTQNICTFWWSRLNHDWVGCIVEVQPLNRSII